MNLHIRTVVPDDLSRCAAIERTCFPPEQAASRETIARRIAAYPGHVLVGELGGEIVGYVMGPVVDRPYIEDDMFSDTACHREDNPHQAVFSLAVMPAAQRQGFGAQLLHAMTALARREGRQSVTLTCLKEKIRYYESLGFVSRGPSASRHGGVLWYNMVKELP